MLSILIIPAASALPSFYSQIVTRVSQLGHEISALHLPSIGLVDGPRPGAPPDMYEDAAFIAARITELADAGKDVLLVTHSYGGTPATQSIKNLSKVERGKCGNPGGVVGLAYMTSLVPEVGFPASTRPLSPLMEIGENGWLYYPDIPLAAKVVFSDLPQDQGEYWAKKMVNHSAASFSTPLTFAGYESVPVWYLVAEGDQSIKQQTQRSQIDMIERLTGEKVDVSTTHAGHVPPISASDDVVNWIVKVAEKCLGRQ